MGAAGEIWQSFCIKTSKVFQGGRIGANDIPKQVISGALLAKVKSTTCIDLGVRAFPNVLARVDR